MFEIPEDILKFFFDAIKESDNCDIEICGLGAVISPSKEKGYYKPVICIINLEKFRASLIHYVEALNEFYCANNNLAPYHTLAFFLRRLLLNITSSDAEDFSNYVDKMSCYFSNKQFEEFDCPSVISIFGNVKFIAQRKVACPGLETPYVLIFSMEINGKIHQLPLIRYAFDENDTCHIFAVQYGRNRAPNVDDLDFNNLVNKVKDGGPRYKGVSPSFVLSLALFFMLLNERNITDVLVPDFLFGRYRTYYKASGEKKSDEILYRILNNLIKVFQITEKQIDGVEITYYPNDIDSYTHVRIGKLDSDNPLLKTLFRKKTNFLDCQK